MEVTKKSKDEVHIKEDGVTYKYWIHGSGVIPLHKHRVKKIDIEAAHRRYIKDNLIYNQ